MRVLGQVLSLGIAALFLSVIVGSVELSHELADEFLDAFQISFIVFAAMCFLGVLPSLARGTVRGSSAP
ncbi:MAG TPA: MFS transporter, partial [Thermoplasmata archaeon]